MWTRVRLFFRKHFTSVIVMSLRSTQADIDAVPEQVLAVSSKLTYLQTRRKVTESAVCALDDAVTKIVADFYPGVVANTALAAAAQRVRDRLKAERDEKERPMLPALNAGEDIPGVKRPPTNDAPPPGDADAPAWDRPAAPPPGAVIDAPYPWKHDPKED